MGGWDFYCALCGGPFGPIYWETEEEMAEGMHDDQRDDCYERDVLSGPEDPELAWLEENRIIGENPDSESLCKVWISGPALYDMYGNMSYEPGEDLEAALDNHGNIAVYSWDGDDPWSAPFHVRCREILCRYLRIPVSELEKEAFFETLKGMAQEEQSGRCLDIDYGDISDQLDQYWRTTRESEHFVFNPVEVKGLDEFLTDLPHRDMERPSTGTTFNTNGDPFVSLPPDVLMLIMSHIETVATVFKLRRASPAFANTDLSTTFWKDHLCNIPWLWELPPLISSHERDGIDWERVYRKLYWGSKRFSRKKNKMYGLCNRRRIWEQMCPEFAETYLKNKTLLREWGSITPIVLKGAFETPPKNLTLPWPIDDKPSPQTLMDRFTDLPIARPSFEISWTADGQLIDICVLDGGQLSNNASRGPNELSAGTDNVPIPDGDWPTGFIVTTIRTTEPVRRQVVGLDVLFAKRVPVQLGFNEGDKCLVRVKNDSFLVAIKVYHTPDDLLSKIQLIEQALVHSNGCLRVVDDLKDNYSTDSMRYLWHRELPPPNTVLAPPPEPSPFSSNDDLFPMEFLMFGTSEEELADVTGLSVDIQLGGLEVTYGHRNTRSIGPRHQAMKTLKIDGNGGERIVRIYVARAQDVTKSMRFVTNRGRYLVAGESNKHGLALDILHSRDTLMMPCGLCGFWQKDNGSLLDWRLGSFGSTTVGYVDKRKIPTLAKDAAGFLWEPSRLPPELSETGIIWGSCGIYDGAGPSAVFLPSTACTVSWLDCRRPLSEVCVTLTHSAPEMVHITQGVVRQTPISAITFKYADGEVATVGPSKFPMEPTCECHKSEPNINEELATVPHYYHQTWLVGGKKLTALRIWRPKTTGLAAMQLVAEGQTESPVWGHWNHDAADKDVGELHFTGEAGGEIVGLKVFFQSIERKAARSDSIMGGIQGLKFVNPSKTF